MWCGLPTANVVPGLVKPTQKRKLAGLQRPMGGPVPPKSGNAQQPARPEADKAGGEGGQGPAVLGAFVSMVCPFVLLSPVFKKIRHCNVEFLFLN